MSGIPTTWIRVLVGIGICVVVAIPIVLFALKNPMFSTYLSRSTHLTKPTDKSIRFSARSEVTGYTLRLEGTQYLDTITEKLGLFETNGVITPKSVRENTIVKDRVSVSRVEFILVPALDTFITAKLGTEPNGGRPTMWGKAEYSVKKDTLVVRVYLDFVYLTRGPFAQKFYLEDALVQIVTTLLQTATKVSDPASNAQLALEMQAYAKDYLYTGILPWPFRIEESRAK